MSYKTTVVKFNNGSGAVLCNMCHAMLVDGCDINKQIDCAHLCDECYHENCIEPIIEDLFEPVEDLMKTYSRFDLEAQIQKCWQITDEIEDLYKLVGDSPDFAGIPARVEDELMNYLLGMKTIYERKFDYLWTMFEKMVDEEVIR